MYIDKLRIFLTKRCSLYVRRNMMIFKKSLVVYLAMMQ